MLIKFKRILVFTLAFIQYVFLHSCRSTWSYVSGRMSQPGIDNYFSSQYLGYINFAFLFSYGLTVSAFLYNLIYRIGQLGDRMNLKSFVLIGAFSTSLIFCCIGFFLHYEYKHPYLFMVLQILNGVSQSTEWSGLLAILNNWYQGQNKILILGYFSASPCVGNIIGDLYSGSLIGKHDLPYYAPIYMSGISLFTISMINLFALQECPLPNEIEELCEHQESMSISLEPILNIYKENSSDSQEYSLPSSHFNKEQEQVQLSYFDAWFVPNVAMYAFAFGCIKAVYYILGFWLPEYLNRNNVPDVAWITAMTDIGAAPGGIIICLIGYYSHKRAILQVPSLWIGTIVMIIINYADDLSLFGYLILVFIIGFLIGGTYNNIAALITVELSNQDQLKNNKKATATIVSLIIGYASAFSAINQLIVPLVKDALFLYCGLMSIIGGILLSPLLIKEIRHQNY
ncbi:unnamed protein product [Paramecium sonneborni]|uniref:Major facilitator superfamily (MFS) profile domain-containing protein n=1 Tax=Paramecium sonneborni TaxID=65129 RepID=A0A8S1M7T9_9CILI|nr:unnamed protein product [Paramecium sonneborni]